MTLFLLVPVGEHWNRSSQLDVGFEVLLFALAVVFGLWHHVQPRPIAWLREIDMTIAIATLLLAVLAMLFSLVARLGVVPTTLFDTPVIACGVLLLANMLVELLHELIVRGVPRQQLPRARVVVRPTENRR
jgi:hypothetical protein